MNNSKIVNSEKSIMSVRLSFWKQGKGDKIAHPSTAYIKELIILRNGSRYLIQRDLRAAEYNQIKIKDFNPKKHNHHDTSKSPTRL